MRGFAAHVVRRFRRWRSPAPERVRLPLSRAFGADRGTPIDRLYIEDFLARCSGDIAGHVLEIGEATYSKRFGSGIIRQDVLHVHSHPAATIIGDLTQPNVLPEQAFDCVIITQTLQFIYDIHAAVRQLYRALRPGGTVLATFPGISSTGFGEWAEGWCWSLTGHSAERLFGEVFGREIDVSTYGNVYAATCFLEGLALEEVDTDALKEIDATYPVIISIRARRLA